MRYLHQNDDGTIGLWTCVPLRLVRADGAVFHVVGHNTPNGRTVLIGRWTGLPTETVTQNLPDREFETINPKTKRKTTVKVPQEPVIVTLEKPEPPFIDIGEEGFDIGELQPDSVPGFTIEFPDFDLDIKAKLPQPARDKIRAYRHCEKTEIPADYSFRAAWRDGGQTITHDMEKCRDITRDRLRKARAPLLAQKDIEAIKALEAGDSAKLAEVTAEKQRLRDITALPGIDSAKTPEELKAIALA